jgi:hypothetical protein
MDELARGDEAQVVLASGKVMSVLEIAIKADD